MFNDIKCSSKINSSLLSIHADFLVAAPGKVAFEVSDFFKYTVPNESRFDLIFDYLLVPVSYAAALRNL